MQTSRFKQTIAVLAAAGLAFLAATAEAKPASKWRITFDHQADNDGSIVFRVAQIEGTPVDVETKIPAGTTENKVADLVTASLKATLGKENFHVEVDDGESVIIKKRGKTKKFELTLASNSSTGLNINIKHE